VHALAVGFLVALLIFGDDDNNTASTTAAQPTTTDSTTQTGTPGTTTTSSTTTAQQGTTPGNPPATVDGCIALWNQQNNRGNQTFLVNLMTRQPIRVHVGVTTDVPPQCLITVVANDGSAYVFPEGGGTTFPYATAPAATPSSKVPAAQKTSNALEQRDGTLQAR
jgi:hypothetical protein